MPTTRWKFTGEILMQFDAVMYPVF